MYPALYTGVVRQVARTTDSELQTPAMATVLLSAVARDLFRTDITWGKVSLAQYAKSNALPSSINRHR